jgi:hypothetical protein
MDVQTNVAPATGAGSVVPVTTDDSGPLSVREAADRFGARRQAAEKPPETEKPATQRGPNGQFARQETNTAEAVEQSAPAEEQTSAETEEQVEPAEQPSIDPPRSWSKEDKDAFKLLPPETQQRIVEQDRKRESEVRKGQNEAAQIRQAAEAARTQAEQARQQFETGLNEVLLRLSQDGEFADIKTPKDVEELAERDPFQFNRWQAKQLTIGQLQQQANAMRQQREAEQRTQFEGWAGEQDKAFTQKVKDFSDPEKATKLRAGVVNYLTEVRGVPADTIPQLWQNPMFRDARMQEIVFDAYRFHEGQKAAKAAIPKSVPAPQRPGTAPSKADAQKADIAVLEQKLDKATSERDQIAAAAALRAAKRVAAR